MASKRKCEQFPGIWITPEYPKVVCGSLGRGSRIARHWSHGCPKGWLAGSKCYTFTGPQRLQVFLRGKKDRNNQPLMYTAQGTLSQILR